MNSGVVQVVSATFVAPTIQTLAVDPNNPLAIYAGTDKGVYKSGDGGATWVEKSKGMNQNSYGGNSAVTANVVSVIQFAFDPTYSNKVWAVSGTGSPSGGIWFSKDAGGSWSQNQILGPIDPATQQPANSEPGLSNGYAAQLTANASVAMYSVAVDSTGVVWATRPGTSGNSVFFSANNGGTWYEWATAASLSPTNPNPDLTKPWGAAFGNHNAANIVVDNTTTPPTIYVGSKGGGTGIYKWQCPSNCIQSLQRSTIDGVTPTAVFTQLPTSGIGANTGINWLAYNALVGFQAGTTAGTKCVFVSELDPNGAKLVFSTYLGGTGGEDGNAIFVDASGNIYLGGRTSSGAGTLSATSFPATKGAYTTTRPGNREGFVTKLKLP